MTSHLIKHSENLLQYFYILGIDNSDIYKQKLYKSEHTDLNPTMISQFPNSSLPYLHFPDEVIINHCFPNGFNLEDKSSDKPLQKEFFIFSLENISYSNYRQKRVYFTCLLFYESLSDYYLIYNKHLGKEQYDTLVTNKHVPKVIAICSFYPMYDNFRRILQEVYAQTSNKTRNVGIPIEKIIENIMFTIPSPPPGLFKVEFDFFKKKLIFEQAAINKVPMNNIDINVIFEYFNVTAFMSLIKCVMLEIPLLFFCQNKDHLTNIIEGLTSLIYPLKYAYPIISILPINYYSLIQTLSCFIIGINASYTDNIFEEGKYDKIEFGNKNVVIVKLDYSMKVRYEIIQKSPKLEEPLISLTSRQFTYSPAIEYYNSTDLPLHYKTKTINNLKKILQSIKEKQITNKSIFNSEIQKAIYYFIVSVMLDYHNYLTIIGVPLPMMYEKYKQYDLPIDNLVKIKDYINFLPQLDRPFFERLFNTRLFYDFITKKMFPSSTQEKLEILFFDESIVEKKNKNAFKKKISTHFLQSKIFEENYRTITIDCSFHKFSREEKEYLSKEENQLKAIDYYQIIQLDCENGSIIKYPVFPKLLYDNCFFNKKIPQELKIDSLYDDYNTKCQSLINTHTMYDEIYSSFKYDLNLVSTIRIDMRNCIILVWLKMFAMTFWYMKPIEKKDRFDEMIKILQSTKSIEEDIYYLLFTSICEYGDKEMAMTMFQLIPLEHYSLYILLADRLKQLKNKNDTLIAATPVFQVSSNDETITQRSFYRNSYHQNQKKEEIIFKSQTQCKKCNGNIDLCLALKDLKKMPKESFIVTCLACNKTSPGEMEVLINNTKIETFNILTPYQLYTIDWIQSSNKIDVVSFNTQYPDRFWNALYYFSQMNLPNDFLLPYKDSDNAKIFTDLSIQKTQNIRLDEKCKNSLLHEECYDFTGNNNYPTKSKTFGSYFKIKANDTPDISKSNTNSANRIIGEEIKTMRKKPKISATKYSPELKSKLRSKIHKSVDLDAFSLSECRLNCSPSSSPHKNI